MVFTTHVQSSRQYWTIGFGILCFALFMVAMWYGSQPKKDGHGDSGALAGGTGVTAGPTPSAYDNSTISPEQNFDAACTCPKDTSTVMAGAVDKANLIGQVEHEGNDPYDFSMCQANAQEMLDFLQDQELFDYAKSLTRSELGEYPPKLLYYTWDQSSEYCKFYLSCGGVTDCDKRNVASGLVLPSGKPPAPPPDH